ncbi:MAG: methyltransferase domain-containing protein [Hyphomicrobiales bacterium]|nr:methyltransferase domain-containing protein [Hyphomicrobiales bacterium]
MLEFDAETSRLLDIAYQGADITRRRQASFDALQPKPGETVLDIGCGNGLLLLELARAVGPGGQVIGIDPSEDMRKSAENRCHDVKWVEIVDGTACMLPVESGTADKAVSVQVFEYLDNIPGAAREAFRTLRPGGRLVVGDIHFDSLVWFSDHPGRMARMIAAWDNHLIERGVPAILPSILLNVGFVLEDVRPITFCDPDLKPDGLANMMIRLMERYAVANGHLLSGEAQEWAEEQQSLAKAGRFFFSITHFVVCARKP